jgi:hypothetical protein
MNKNHKIFGMLAAAAVSISSFAYASSSVARTAAAAEPAARVSTVFNPFSLQRVAVSNTPTFASTPTPTLSSVVTPVAPVTVDASASARGERFDGIEDGTVAGGVVLPDFFRTPVSPFRRTPVGPFRP